MLKIRLQRVGRSKRPFYRIVVAEHSSPAKSKYIEKIGHYDPLAKEKDLKVDVDRVFEWIKKGAKPSSTLARLLKGDGVKGMEPYISEMKDRKKKKEVEEKPEAPAAEAPAEEKPAEKEEVKPEAEEKPAEKVEAKPEAEEKPAEEEAKPEAEEKPVEEAKADESKPDEEEKKKEEESK